MAAGELTDILRRHKVRLTANRILITRALDEARRPLSLSELEDAVPSVDKSNIFRALMAFKERRLVHVIEDGGDGVRYELCHSHNDENDEDMHVHFFCEKCRRTFCLEGVALPYVDIPEGYESHTANYIVKGFCPECASVH